jgi:hypothetical protein
MSALFIACFRLKELVYEYAAGGGCELAESDLSAVLRRLDLD